jgi:hypothetical protein
MGDLDVDYRELEVPEEKDPPEYRYQERRADILQNYLLDKGHPDRVNWSELARYYDKSKSTLHNDKLTLTEWLVANLDIGRIGEIGTALFEQGLLELQADDDYDPFDLHAFVAKWTSTLDDLGIIDLDDADEDDLFVTDDEGGVTVEIAGVAADDVADMDMPDRTQTDDPADEGEAEEEEAVEA